MDVNVIKVSFPHYTGITIQKKFSRNGNSYYFVKWANEKAKIWNDASLSEDSNLKKVLTEFLSEHQFTEPCTTAHGTWHITKISNGNHLCIFIKGA